EAGGGQAGAHAAEGPAALRGDQPARGGPGDLPPVVRAARGGAGAADRGVEERPGRRPAERMRLPGERLPAAGTYPSVCPGGAVPGGGRGRAGGGDGHGAHAAAAAVEGGGGGAGRRPAGVAAGGGGVAAPGTMAAGLGGRARVGGGVAGGRRGARGGRAEWVRPAPPRGEEAPPLPAPPGCAPGAETPPSGSCRRRWPQGSGGATGLG